MEHTDQMFRHQQIDVGIAVGSAVAMAADLRLNSRGMFSVGLAA
jgi:uncharacterized ferredoxin-like protein